MTTHHLVDPELLPLIDLAPADPITHDNLAETRAQMDARFAGLPRCDIAPSLHHAPGRDGAPDIPVLIYDPGGDAQRPAILYIHGGGMIAGRAELTMLNPVARALARGVVIASVEYRLAPETPFPGPQEDCYAALEWLAAHAAALRIDPARIAISGDSAGGGLAAALALIARDRGGPPICAQLLTYPMLDHRTGGPDDPWANAHCGEFMWTRARNAFGWSALRGSYAGNDARRGWFSPALAESLAGLPPTWMATGSLDLFFDENLDFARRLGAAGVPVELVSYAGSIHGFPVMPGARVAGDYAAAFEGAVARLVVG